MVLAIKEATVIADQSPRLVLRLKMSGAIPPLPHMPSRLLKGIYIYFQVY